MEHCRVFWEKLPRIILRDYRALLLPSCSTLCTFLARAFKARYGLTAPLGCYYFVA